MRVVVGGHLLESELPAVVVAAPGATVALDDPSAREALAGADAVVVPAAVAGAVKGDRADRWVAGLPAVTAEQLRGLPVVDLVSAGRPPLPVLDGAEVAALVAAVEAGTTVVHTDRPRSARRVLTVLHRLQSAAR